jgi:hypothetical protein
MYILRGQKTQFFFFAKHFSIQQKQRAQHNTVDLLNSLSFCFYFFNTIQYSFV